MFKIVQKAAKFSNNLKVFSSESTEYEQLYKSAKMITLKKYKTQMGLEMTQSVMTMHFV